MDRSRRDLERDPHAALLPHEIKAEKFQALFDNAHPIAKAVFLWRSGAPYDENLARSLFKQAAVLTRIG